MDFEKIKEFIRKKDYLVSEHADEERIKYKLTRENREEAILAGEVIEERLDDPRGESRLIAGKTSTGQLVHITIGTRSDKPVIVTVYKPALEKWIRGKIRRRRSTQ